MSIITFTQNYKQRRTKIFFEKIIFLRYWKSNDIIQFRHRTLVFKWQWFISTIRLWKSLPTWAKRLSRVFQLNPFVTSSGFSWHIQNTSSVPAPALADIHSEGKWMDKNKSISLILNINLLSCSVHTLRRAARFSSTTSAEWTAVKNTFYIF